MSEEQLKALRENAEALRSFLRSYDEHARDEQFWGRYGLEQRVHDLFTLTGRLGASLIGALDAIAPTPLQERNDG